MVVREHTNMEGESRKCFLEVKGVWMEGRGD